MNRSERWEKNERGDGQNWVRDTHRAWCPSLSSLIKNHAGELTYRNLGLKNVGGNTCRGVEVILSPRLIDILAQKRKTAYQKLGLKRSKIKLREDIAGKHIYWLREKERALSQSHFYTTKMGICWKKQTFQTIKAEQSLPTSLIILPMWTSLL